MPLAVHVNGEALVKVGTGLETLGVSVDGVDIEINDHVQPVFTDTFGPDVPFDEQQMMQTANIHIALVFYDEAVLSKMRSPTFASPEGVMILAGTLIGASGKYFRCAILSPIAARPWNFPFTRCIGAKRVKVGTRRSIFDISLFAVPYTGLVSSSAGAVLYNSNVITLLQAEALEARAMTGDKKAIDEWAKYQESLKQAPIEEMIGEQT